MKKIISATMILSLVVSVFLIKPLGNVSAAASSVTGQATVVDTDGTLNFSTNNSNVMLGGTLVDGYLEMSGFVWSTDLGWIDFENSDGDGPVKVDYDTGAMSGTALVVDTEGELDFNSNPYNSNVVIDTATGEMSGFAWSTDLGWVDFGETGVTVDWPAEGVLGVVEIGDSNYNSDITTYETTDTTPTLTGTGEPGSTVTITIGELDPVTVTVDEDGAWSYTVENGLTLGDYDVVITMVDSLGISHTVNFTLSIVETVTPTVSTVTITQLPETGSATLFLQKIFSM